MTGVTTKSNPLSPAMVFLSPGYGPFLQGEPGNIRNPSEKILTPVYACWDIVIANL